MKNYIQLTQQKLTPMIERAIKWLVRTIFETIKLAALAFTVMHLITAAIIVEAVMASITVFASVYFSKYWR